MNLSIKIRCFCYDRLRIRAQKKFTYRFPPTHSTQKTVCIYQIIFTEAQNKHNFTRAITKQYEVHWLFHIPKYTYTYDELETMQEQ